MSMIKCVNDHAAVSGNMRARHNNRSRLGDGEANIVPRLLASTRSCWHPPSMDVTHAAYNALQSTGCKLQGGCRSDTVDGQNLAPPAPPPLPTHIGTQRPRFQQSPLEPPFSMLGPGSGWCKIMVIGTCATTHPQRLNVKTGGDGGGCLKSNEAENP